VATYRRHAWDLVEPSGEVLGIAVLRTIEQPWWICDFEPAVAFEQWRGFFERHARAIAAEDAAYLRQHDEDFDATGLRLRSKADRELPNPAQFNLFDLDPNKNMVCFRPTDEYCHDAQFATQEG
jgi:hypothetical protein